MKIRFMSSELRHFLKKFNFSKTLNFSGAVRWLRMSYSLMPFPDNQSILCGNWYRQ